MTASTFTSLALTIILQVFDDNDSEIISLLEFILVFDDGNYNSCFGLESERDSELYRPKRI